MSVPSYPAGTRYIPNNIAVMNQKYAGEANDSNAKYMDGVAHYMPVDTVHALGTEKATNYDFTAGSTGWLGVFGTPPSSITFATNQMIFDTDGSTQVYAYQTLGITGLPVLLTIDIASITGELFLRDGAGTRLKSFTSAGIHTFEYTAGANQDVLLINTNTIGTDTALQCSINSFSSKEITLPTASYIQYLAYPSLTWKQLSSTVDYAYGLIPVSTTWPLTESFQVALTSDAPLEAADILELNADQDLMFKVLFDGYVLKSGYRAANIVGFLDGTSGDTGDYNVYDITDQTFSTFKTIANGTSNVNTNYLNGTTGATNLTLIKDASGRTTGTAVAGTISHTSDGYVDTKFLPNLSIYTIEETVTGNLAILDALGVLTGAFSVRTETRRLIHEEGVGDSLYIDTVLQPYAPSLPNPLVSIKLGNTAVIGYADTITSRSSKFIAKAIVSVP